MTDVLDIGMWVSKWESVFETPEVNIIFQGRFSSQIFLKLGISNVNAINLGITWGFIIEYFNCLLKVINYFSN